MAAQPGTVSPISLQTQEIRLATTMTGGVSLAVWMGGVAREIDLLTQASNLRRRTGQPLRLNKEDPRRFYLDLIDLLDVCVDVDVLSGTSAGGINAGLLAYARACKKDLGRLRDLWLSIGSLLTLLRDPTDANVPSLLQGDGQMFASLQREIPKLKSAPDAIAEQLSTTLFITTTLLDGETSRFTDSYGTEVQDVDNHGMFRFTEENLNNTDALALAARSSASFPAAFEPSFLPFSQSAACGDGLPIRPPVGSMCNVTRDHWAADGGLLDNQPIGAVLQRIFERPAKRLVRRVLLYIVPSTGPVPDPSNEAARDQLDKPYGLLDGLLKDIGAVRNQSIAADLRAIRDHNDRIGVRTDSRLRLAQLAAHCEAGSSRPNNLILLSDELFADYRLREAEVLGGNLAKELTKLLTSWPIATSDEPAAAIPKAWTAAVAPGSTAEQESKQAVAAALTARWPAKPADFGSLACFDQPAFDGAKAIVLSMLRCAFQRAQYGESGPLAERMQLLVSQVAGVHEAFQPDTEPGYARFVAAQAMEPDVRALPLPQAVALMATRYLDTDPRSALQTGWQQLAGIAGELLTDLPAEPAAETGAQPTTDADPHLESSTQPATPPAQPGSRTEQVAVATRNLTAYANYLRPAVNDSDRALRLFGLYAAHRAMLPVGAEVDQTVELIQLSSDTRTLLDLDRRTAASKLTGMQMHHFGAFYKRSWRSNDWLWGRLDGAGWLVHILLDPRRINTAAEPDPAGSRIDGFLHQLAELGVQPPPDGDGIVVSPQGAPPQLLNAATIRAELAYLDDPNLSVPVSLPLTALWVSRSWQERIAAEELLVLADTVLEPDNTGGITETASATTQAWARSVTAASADGRLQRAGELLSSCPIPDETLKSEFGSPLMVRTISKTAAVTAAALHSVRQLPATVRPASSAVRTVALTGYRITNVVKPIPRRMIIVGLALLVVGAALASQQSTFFGLTGMLIAAIGGYLIIFGAWQTSRALLAAVVSGTFVGAAGSLTVPAVRRGLFGQQGKSGGWLGDRVLWLGTQWWHPLAGLGGVLVALALVGLVFARTGSSAGTVPQRLPQRVTVAIAAFVALVVVVALAVLVAWKG
jgi:patatin-related protein